MKKNVFGYLAAIAMVFSAGNASATAQLVKSASYEHGLINSYVFEHPDTKMFVSPILWNRPGLQVIENSSGKVYGYRFGTNIGSGNSTVAATRGSPAGKLIVPAISGTYANHTFQVREDAMVFYKDHQKNWKVGLSAQHGRDPVWFELSSAALKTVTDASTIGALNDAKDIFAGHYILTNGGRLFEVTASWGYGTFTSLTSAAILNDVVHVRAISDDQLAAITSDNKIYRLTKSESPALLGTIASGMVEATKKSATRSYSATFSGAEIIVQDGPVVKNIAGDTLYVIRSTSHHYQDVGNLFYAVDGVFLDKNFRTSKGLEIPIGREFIYKDDASFTVETYNRLKYAAVIAEQAGNSLKITTGRSTKVNDPFEAREFSINGLPNYGKLLTIVAGGGGTSARTYIQHPEHGIVYLDRYEYVNFQTINHLTINYERGAVFIPIKVYKDNTLTTPQYVAEPISINGELVYFTVENQKMIPDGYAIDPISGGLVNTERTRACHLSTGDLTVSPGSSPQQSVSNPNLSGYQFYSGVASLFHLRHQLRTANCVDRAVFAAGSSDDANFYINPWEAHPSTLQIQQRQAGASSTFAAIDFLDRAGYPSQPIAVGITGGHEALIAPFTVMGLNPSGNPYIRGVVSRWIQGVTQAHERPARFSAVADDLLLDTGALYLDDASATKGKHADKIVASWKSNGQTFTVTPKRCNKSGSSCTDFAPTTLSETQFTHDSSNGLDSSIKQASLSRMFYQVEAARVLDIYPSHTSTEKRTVIETKTATTSPGYLSSPPTSTSGQLVVDSNTDGAIVQITSNDTDEDNNHRYEILTPPQHGTARIGSDGTIRYSVGNYHGTDTLTYRLHDGMGHVDGVASITVSCPAPEVLSVTPPANTRPWDSNLFDVTYRANACNGTQLNLRISAGSGSQTEIPRYTKVSSVASANVATKAVTNLVDPDPGTYVVRVEVSSVSIPANKRSEVVEVTINGYSQAVLDIDNATPNEDQMITAKAYLSGGECAFYPTEQLAKNSFGCFATWNNTLYATSNSVLDNKSKLSGYAPLGGPHQVVATIYKVDNSRTPRYVATAQQSVNVAPGAGVTFANPVFPKNQRQFVDFVDFSVNVANEADCVVTTSETMALAEALAGQKVCLVEYSKLPAGLTASSDGTTRVTGRIESVATPSLVEYKVSKFYANRPKTLALTETFTIPVDASVMAGTLTLDRPEYAKGLQVATATASITGNPTCTITNSTAEAKASHGKAGTLACYGEWNNLPSWMSARPGSRLNVAGTVPATAGDYPLSYSLYMIDAADKRTLIGTYSGNVKVVNVSQIAVTIQGSGRSLENAAGETIYTVDHNGRVGSATFTAGQFSTVRTTITQGASVPIVMSGIKSGDTKEITIPGTSAPAWEIRTAQLRVEYEGISDTSQTRTQDIKVAQLPPMSSLSAIIFRPSTQLVDTESFALDAAIGVPSGMSSVSYLQSSHGRWRGWLASKEADALVPITPEQDANAFGEFRFLDLTYQAVIGKSVVLVAEPILPNGLTLSTPLNLVSDVQRLEFASGGPILAAAFVDKPKGMAPHTARFTLQVSQQVAANLGVTTWEVSSDGGSTWEALSQIGTSSAHVFADGGRYLVRANMSNKHSGVMSTTDPIVVNVGQLLSLTLTANERQIPGYPAVVTLDVQRILGGSIDHDSEWVVTSNDGQRITRNNISEITLESDKPASYDIAVRAKPRFMSASDNETWTTVRKQVQFAWPEPVRISIAAPKRTEVGVPVAMTAKVTSRDMVRASNLTLLGEWILPDGATTDDPLDGETINVTFDPEAWTNNSNADVQYRAWLNEARDKSEALVTHRTQISKYEFARFVINKKSETAIAPAYLRIQVEPADTNERKKIGSQKITYAWSVPEAEGLTAKVSGNSLTITATTPGEYPVVVEVQDERGNTQELNYDFVVQEPGNHAVSLGLKAAQKFNRPPMKYSLRPVVTGGHPSDKITKFDLFLNDDLLSSSVGSRPPRALLINESGQHTIKLVATSAMEKVSTGEEVVTVNENANPVCEDIKVVWDRKGTSASVTSKCSDTDGRIKSYRWLLNGEVMDKRTGNRVSLSPAMIGSSSEVTFQVTDDSGGMTEQRVTLSPPGATFR